MQIREGLIGVPPRMLNDVVTMVAREVLWWARDRLKGKMREMPQHARELKVLAAQYWPEGIPAKPYRNIALKPIVARKRVVDLTGMGAQYEEREPTQKEYFIAIDWRSGQSSAAWSAKRTALIIYPMSQDWLARFPERRAEETLSGYIRHLINSAEHELRHAVQTLVIEPIDPRQTRLNTGYGDRNVNDPKSLVQYYLSPVEFDPTIGSCAQEFVEEMRLHESYGKKINLGKALRTYVGIIPAKTFTTDFRTAPFFMVLRRHAKAKYRLAVKKFIAEVTRLLDPATELNEAQLTEGQIPETLYGYWIDADGKFHVVPRYSHLEVIWELGMRTYSEAYLKGWIRVVAQPDRKGQPNELTMKFYTGEIGIRTAIAAKSLARQGFRSFVIDMQIPKQGGARALEFLEPGPAIAAIDAARKRKPVNSSPIRETLLREFDGTTQQAMLYHGSKNSSIVSLSPRSSHLVGRPVVFAATFLDVAVAMAGHWTDDDFEFGRIGQDDAGQYIRYQMKELRAGAFREFFQKPTYVYLLPREGFKPDDNIQDFEMVSTSGVEPISFVTVDDPMAFLKQSPIVEIVEFGERATVEEADKGGELSDTHEWGEVQKMNFDPRQAEMFPGSRYEFQGSFDGFDVATVIDSTNHEDSYTYAVFRSGEPVAYAELLNYSPEEDHSHIPNDDCYSVVGVRVATAGQSLAPRLYAWFVTGGFIDRLYGDDIQTDSGAAIWRKLLGDRRVRLFAHDPDTGVRPITTPEELESIYDDEETRVFATRRENAGRGRATS